MYSVGCFIAFPLLYPETAYIHQMIGTFLLYQVVVNWWFIHVTDSSFNSSEYAKEKLGPYPFKVRYLKKKQKTSFSIHFAKLNNVQEFEFLIFFLNINMLLHSRIPTY
jgi:hypothetical protein